MAEHRHLIELHRRRRLAAAEIEAAAREHKLARSKSFRAWQASSAIRAAPNAGGNARVVRRAVLAGDRQVTCGLRSSSAVDALAGPPR